VGGDLALRFGVTTCFSGTASQVIWQGLRFLDATEFDEYLSATVASRLEDREQGELFEADMRALASTGVATDTLYGIRLKASIVGEQRPPKAITVFTPPPTTAHCAEGNTRIRY
jgi:hypothetical protein